MKSSDLAARVRAVVRASASSQREFAARIGMDHTALSKALHGTRQLREDEVAAIAKAGGVSQRYLRTGVGRGPGPALTRPRADPVEPDIRRAQILDATAKLIARKGFHHVRVADIAKACGTSTGTIHYHFPTKNDALNAALTYYADRFHRRIETEFRDATSPADKIRRLIEIQLPATDEDADEWSIWIQTWNEAILDPAQRPGQREIYTRWRQVVVDCLGSDLLADRFTSMVDGLAIQVLAQTTEMTVDRMREILTDTFVNYLVSG
ncbi:TetR family transcriptional regulator C-terminal domain-containing protein [Kibdelosporangium philippinense]|uniref:TetR family transcriptional regulator C-terminal domain-containing protein n=1 Tax=Kibdelosporangium philippinense TaxID=211113 RepID=A0ABS8ZKV2_9PSEU|nr:TetR family transcriptional regulator C-terminal domain-containing protein [Kibdelosporangium philippinense]MCE7008122.1 TetR family transcriptional regulator C-terminal domain-containing protein [Kibdelosporangium philippinense]